MTQTVK